MAKKLLILLIILFLVITFFIPKNISNDEKGRGLVLLTYSFILAVTRVLKKLNGEGLKFRTPSFQNPITRQRIYNATSIAALILCIIGILLSVFLYKELNLSYMYDFITLLVVLLIIWNVSKLVSGKIEQDLDPKLNQKPLKDRKKD